MTKYTLLIEGNVLALPSLICHANKLGLNNKKVSGVVEKLSFSENKCEFTFTIEEKEK